MDSTKDFNRARNESYFYYEAFPYRISFVQDTKWREDSGDLQAADGVSANPETLHSLFQRCKIPYLLLMGSTRAEDSSSFHGNTVEYGNLSRNSAGFLNDAVVYLIVTLHGARRHRYKGMRNFADTEGRSAEGSCL